MPKSISRKQQNKTARNANWEISRLKEMLTNLSNRGQ
nr:MAG TPA: hypothetical protein [Caudoviricetes sp.]